MSVKVEEFAEDFVMMKKLFEKLGLELIGTKDHNNEKVYLVKKDKSQ
jgi:deoxyxylulose-5-phosphate synthase